MIAVIGNMFLMPAVVTAETPSLKETTFNVLEFLKLKDTDQKSAYFDPNGVNGSYKEYSPIVRLILMILDYATKIIGSIAIILLIVAGFMYMVSQGNQQSLEKARDMLKYTIIGLIVTFSSYIITLFVQSVLTVSK